MQPTLEGEYKKTDIDALNKGINEPIYDLLDREGKQWRPLLGMMFAEAMGRQLDDFETNKDIYFACGLTELVHNASLIVDDIEDNSEKRRGEPCLHKKYGVDVSINAGNYLMIAPITKISQYIPIKHQLPIYEIYGQEMQNLHTGQGWDIQWHNWKGKTPTEAQYFHMVENKTSCLPRMCIRMVSQLTDQDPELTTKFVNYVNALGAAFQIQDDLIALTSEAYREQRGAYCEDIQEGKRSLMIIYSYFYGWHGDKLIDLLDQKSSNPEVHKEAIRILQQEGAIEYGKEKAQLIMRRAWRELDTVLPQCDAKEDIKDLSNFLINRSI